MSEKTEKNILRHLGVIADGNRRWARQNGLPTIEGHKKGIDVIEELTEAAGRAGIKYVTFYVFSTENWGRSSEEVDYIMKLVETRILKYAEKLAKKDARMLILGSKDHLSDRLLTVLNQAEEITKKGTSITVCFCFNYGGEQEIADAATKALTSLVETLPEHFSTAKIDPSDSQSLESEQLSVNPLEPEHPSATITPAMIRANLYHPEVPNVDLVVRTSGEQRISGFMLWRAAYAEFLFLEKFFPEMTAADIPAIISEFNSRQRRFGK